jgi:integrase
LEQLKLPPVSLHALRHTHASQLIASGMDVAHHLFTPRARITITLNIYGHLFGKTDGRAADVIARAFGKVLAAENPDQIGLVRWQYEA